MVADERERPDVKRRRDRWQRHQRRIDPKRLVFIDENEPCRAIGPSDYGE
jgi:hypothetical protein